jgi:hypothetical protein
VGIEPGLVAQGPTDPVPDGTERPAHATTTDADPPVHADAPPDSNTFADAAADSATNVSTDTRPDRASGADGATQERSPTRRCPDPRHSARSRAAPGGLS